MQNNTSSLIFIACCLTLGMIVMVSKKMENKPVTHIIIGASAAGISAAQTLRSIDQKSNIIVLSREHEQPYNTCRVDGVLAGRKSEEDIQILTLDQAKNMNIELMLGKEVVAIDADKHEIRLQGEHQPLHYDTLLLATGTRPIYDEHAQGVHTPGVFLYNTLCNIKAINEFITAHNVSHVVVVGGGLCALECASALHEKLKVTLINQSEQLLGARSDKAGSDFILQAMKQANVSYVAHATIKSIESQSGRVDHVMLSNGTSIECQLVIFACKTAPNNELAIEAGLQLDNGFIKVDEHMRTSNPYIFAAGDIIMVKDLNMGKYAPNAKWSSAKQQGKIAAYNMAGLQEHIYPGSISIFKTKIFGVRIMLYGTIHDPSDTLIKKVSPDHYYVIAKNSENSITGFFLVYDADSNPDVSYVKDAVTNYVPVSDHELEARLS